MPFSKSIHLYHDIALVLASAREAGGAVYRLPSASKAANWRMRAYYYRKLLAEADEQRHAEMPGYTGSTQWDDMNLSLEGDAVRIQFGVVAGKLERLDGGKLELVPVAPKARPTNIVDSELLGLAVELAAELDK